MTAPRSRLGEFASTWEAEWCSCGRRGVPSTHGRMQVHAHTGACSGTYIHFAAGGAGSLPDSPHPTALFLCQAWRWLTLILQIEKSRLRKSGDDRGHTGRKQQTVSCFWSSDSALLPPSCFCQAWASLVWSCRINLRAQLPQEMGPFGFRLPRTGLNWFDLPQS